MKIKKDLKCFEGRLLYIEHESPSTKTRMNLSLFIPSQKKGFTLTWLSGLTCNEENFTTKAGAYKKASELGISIIVPDTSPRGEDVPDEEAYDLGQGAGFYLNACEEPWKKHFQMYSYVIKDLQIVLGEFSLKTKKQGIFGHSMGGHGALTIGLKHPDIYQSISAFSPIVAPTQVPWGTKAFEAYLGKDKTTWGDYDACTLVALTQSKTPLLIDQGLQDPFLNEQLRPELFEEACQKADHPLTLRRHEGYDHSYFFISTFIEDHLDFHKKHLTGYLKK